MPALLVEALVSHRARQAEHRLLLGPAYKNHDLVVARDDGLPLHPDGFTHGFALPEAPEPMSALAIPRVGIWSHDGLSALRVKTTNWYLALRSSRAYPLARAVRQLGRRRVAA